MREKKESSRKSTIHHMDDYQIGYKDIIRCIDSGDLKRFYQSTSNIDLNSLQEGNKPFIFHAIQKNDLDIVKVLLDREIDLLNKYQVNINADTNEETWEQMTPLQFAEFLNQETMAQIIESKLNGPSLEERWLKKVATLDLNQIEEFKTKFNNSPKRNDYLNLGLIKAAEFGSNRLIDYFLSNQEVNINSLYRLDNILVTPLLKSIEFKKNETTKYLIFRKANIHLCGEFGDSLVTAVHFENSNDMITLLLEKGASLSSRHKLWPNLNLREYCIQTNKIQSKLAIDNFVFKLIANGEYDKLKKLTDKGYININVTNQFKKTGRDLAMERSHVSIVQLIDKIEQKQRRLRTKMNY